MGDAGMPTANITVELEGHRRSRRRSEAVEGRICLTTSNTTIISLSIPTGKHKGGRRFLHIYIKDSDTAEQVRWCVERTRNRK